MGGSIPFIPKPKSKPAPSFNTDSQGRLVSNLTGKLPTIVAAPTTAEVSQSEATAADGTGAMSRKVKRKGRSATILTSSSGVDQSVTLGTQSLLGG
jgi:hypothetical protein